MHVEQLAPVDGAAAQLEVDGDVGADRRRGGQASRCSAAWRRRSCTYSSMSAWLRSAWIPPAVAQAPIVTSRREAARISRMRSASWAVVTDPSTRDRSYGPSTVARVASRK